MKEIKNSGLSPKSKRKDIRRFRYSRYKDRLGASILHENDLLIKPLRIFDQLASDLCTAFAITSLREDTENVALAPEFQYALSKEIEGKIDTFGADIKDALKAATKGALEQELCPLSLEKDGRDKVADIRNYPSNLRDAAYVHKGKSYFEAEGQNNLFDSIREVLINQNRGVVTGGYWQSNWNYEPIAPEYNPVTYRKENPHAFVIRGQKNINGKLYLVVQNSYGLNVGEDGFFFLPRSQVNKLWFAYTILDADPNDVKRETWGLLERIANWLIKTLESLKKKEKEEKPIERTPPVIDSVPIERKSRIKEWAKAIEEFENAPKDWNNPGAIKNKQGNFLRFDRYSEGFEYLCDYLTRACTGLHRAYSKGGETTLKEFTYIYAPPIDKNPTEKYLAFVADKLKVELQIKIKELL